MNPCRDEHTQKPLHGPQRSGCVKRLEAEQLESGGLCDREIAQRGREAAACLPPLLAQLEFVQRLEQPIADRAEQLVATVEVVVDRHRLDAEPRTQAAHAERARLLLLDQCDRAIEDQHPGSAGAGDCAAESADAAARDIVSNWTLHCKVELMDHTQLLSRVLRDIANARAAITVGYQRLWHPADASSANPDDAQPGAQRGQEPAIGEERPSADPDSR